MHLSALQVDVAPGLASQVRGGEQPDSRAELAIAQDFGRDLDPQPPGLLLLLGVILADPLFVHLAQVAAAEWRAVEHADRLLGAVGAAGHGHSGLTSSRISRTSTFSAETMKAPSMSKLVHQPPRSTGRPPLPHCTIISSSPSSKRRSR